MMQPVDSTGSSALRTGTKASLALAVLLLLAADILRPVMHQQPGAEGIGAGTRVQGILNRRIGRHFWG